MGIKCINKKVKTYYLKLQFKIYYYDTDLRYNTYTSLITISDKSLWPVMQIQKNMYGVLPLLPNLFHTLIPYS